MGRRALSSWLAGPGPGPGTSGGPTGSAGAFPGQRLGRPQDGSRSVGRVGPRLFGVLIDWLIALAVARVLLRSLGWGSFGPLVVFLVEQAVLVGSAGASVGHRLAGLQVETLAGQAPGLGRAAVRSVLLCLAVPALIWDRDQRGLHDRMAGTLVARR